MSAQVGEFNGKCNSSGRPTGWAFSRRDKSLPCGILNNAKAAVRPQGKATREAGRHMTDGDEQVLLRQRPAAQERGGMRGAVTAAIAAPIGPGHPGLPFLD